MNKQEVAISLAKINMMNSQIAYWMDLNQDVDNISKALEIESVPSWTKGIIDFLNQNPCEHLVKAIEKMHSVDYLRNYLVERRKQYKSRTLTMLSHFADSIENLYECAALYRKMYKGQYWMLEDVLANDKAVSLLKRAIDAGYLDYNYMPQPHATELQLKAIAYAIGQLLNLHWRIQWITFERQWKRHRLATKQFPADYPEKLKDIIAIFPEIDFSVFREQRKEDYFRAPSNESRIEELFLGLLTYEYIDKRTTYSQFRRIFNLKSDKDPEEFVPVNWIKPQISLIYFIHNTFSKSNRNFWIKTAYCFTVNGQMPNKETLKTGLRGLSHYCPDVSTYDTCLLELAKQFNRKD